MNREPILSPSSNIPSTTPLRSEVLIASLLKTTSLESLVYNSSPLHVHDITYNYFAKEPDRLQRQHLVAAAPGFVRVPKVESPSYDIWSIKSVLGEFPDTKSHISRLLEGHQRIDQASKEYACAARLYYIFLEHEIEDMAFNFSGTSTSVGKANSQKTITSYVYKEITTNPAMTSKSLSNDRTRGRHYYTLLELTGLGDLLDLSDDATTL